MVSVVARFVAAVNFDNERIQRLPQIFIFKAQRSTTAIFLSAAGLVAREGAIANCTRGCFVRDTVHSVHVAHTHPVFVVARIAFLIRSSEAPFGVGLF